MKRGEFIKKALEIHGDRYGYDNLPESFLSKQKIPITCWIHGEFLTLPRLHLDGRNCIKCMGKNKLTKEEFIVNAKTVHGEKYDYNKAAYINNSTKIEIICPKHGSFYQKPNNHVANKSGCPACTGNARTTLESFIDKSNKMHGNAYDYSKVIYKNSGEKVEIICPKHGSFWQVPYEHTVGRGCVPCGVVKCSVNQKMSLDEFIKRSNEIHNNKFDYSKVVLNSLSKQIEIICPKHGVFTQKAAYHINGYGCRQCANVSSKGENEIGEWLESEGFTILKNNRDILSGMEMDIYIPEKSIGIEFNGAYWHSEERMKHPRMHEIRSFKARKLGINIITIWDFDWITRPEFIKALLLHRIGKNKGEKLNARSCAITTVSSKDASEFYNKTHIQGSCGSPTVTYGLLHNEKLVACMSFSKGSTRRGKTGEWELSRYSTEGMVRGGGSKLFNAFIKEHNPRTVWSFSDEQHFNGNLYPILGFIKDGHLPADYRVYDKGTGKLWHKSAWQRKNMQSRLNELGINEIYDHKTDVRTEKQMQKLAGVFRIMDSGKTRWKWSS